MKQSMEFSEKFIDKEIAELCQNYDSIFGTNKNVARITPELIDGLKPVQRRALYIMFQKDGGKTFRKLATISGEVFGRVHPHCLRGTTKFVLADGTIKTIKELCEAYGEDDVSYAFNWGEDEPDIVTSPIYNYQITKYVNEYYQIILSTGECIECTDDHLIFMYDFVYQEAKDMHVGDKLYTVSIETKEEPTEPVIVSEVNVIKCDHEPMYDFTSEEHSGAILIGNGLMGIVHNSPVAIEDAIVNIAQEWHNLYPLVEGDGNFGTCMDPDSEVFVYDHFSLEEGKRTKIVKWMKFKDYYDVFRQCGPIASIDPETGTWIWETPSDAIKMDYSGKMIRGFYKGGDTDEGVDAGDEHNGTDNESPPAKGLSGDNIFCDFKVTPDHDLVIQVVDPPVPAPPFGDTVPWGKEKADNLPNIWKFKVADVHVPKPENPSDLVGKEVPLTDIDAKWEYEPFDWESPCRVINAFGQKNVPLLWWFRMIAIVLARGILYKGRKIEIEDLGQAEWAGMLEDKFEIGDIKKIKEDPIVQWFLDYDEPEQDPPKEVPEGETPPPEPPYEPHVPDILFKLDEKYLRLWIEVYNEAAGGGEHVEGGLSIKTRGKLMADQFQGMAMMLANFARIGETDPGSSNPTAASFSKDFTHVVCGVQDLEVPIRKNRAIKEEIYEGKVYCVTMPTYETFASRRNDVTMLSGNCTGDRAAASRYIKARLSEYSIACFFEDWKESVVDMELAYDEETMMPLYLPSKYPNVLLNGCLGIGYGTSSNIPCFNFREIVEATITLMNNPKAQIVLIPDSPTGADIIETDFVRLSDTGSGSYMQRCKYTVDPETNMVTITTLPDLVTARVIREKIADIKESGGLSELIGMNDLSGKTINIQLIIRDDVNPYKFMRKLISEVPGLERTYPVCITVTNDYRNYDFSIKQLLLEWIKYRQEQKRVSISNKRTNLTAEQRINDIKLFIMNDKNLSDTIHIFKTSRNRAEIEERLLDKYKNTEIRMDSVQARTLSNMRMVELSMDAHDSYKKRAEELIQELREVEEILNTPNGINKVIIAELRDGMKRFNQPRRSNVVPYKISVSNEVEGMCILQLSSDGTIIRTLCTNAEEEPIPTDSNGFACLVDNDSSFILIDDVGMYTSIKVKELPVDTSVPVWRYAKKPLSGSIIAMLPVEMGSEKAVTLISRKGVVKKIKIADMGPSKKPCIALEKNDRIIKGVCLGIKSKKDILVYTKNGMGQRLDPNLIRITSPNAKGSNGFKLRNDDEIVGCYAISPESNQYLLYVTMKGKMRLNLIEYLPTRTSKYDAMVQLITLNDRDKLIAVIGCNKYDTVTVYYDDSTSEVVNIAKIPETTMSSEPKKMTVKNAVSSNIVKVKVE